MTDETTDTARLEQMVLCIRYNDSDIKGLTIRGGFVNFAVVSDLSGSSLATAILENLKKPNINLENMVG